MVCPTVQNRTGCTVSPDALKKTKGIPAPNRTSCTVLVTHGGGESGLKSDLLTILQARHDGGLGDRDARDFHSRGHKGAPLYDVAVGLPAGPAEGFARHNQAGRRC